MYVTFSMATVSFSLAADASLLADAMVAGAVGPLDDTGGSTAATAMSLATMAAVAVSSRGSLGIGDLGLDQHNHRDNHGGDE